MLVFLGELLMQLGDIAHGFGSFARMRGVVPGFRGQCGFDAIVVPGYVCGELFLQLGVVFVLDGVIRKVRGQFQVILGGFMRPTPIGRIQVLSVSWGVTPSMMFVVDYKSMRKEQVLRQSPSNEQLRTSY